MSVRAARRRWAVPAGMLVCLSCSGVNEPATTVPKSAQEEACPAEALARFPLPGVPEEDTRLSTWLERYSDAQLDEPLLSVETVAAYNRNKGRLPGEHPYSQRDLDELPDPRSLRQDLEERLRYLATRVADGSYESRGKDVPLDVADFDPDRVEPTPPEVRVAVRALPLRCGPYPGPLFKSGGDDDLDRNACSTIHTQEPVQILGKHGRGMWLLRTRYATGFIDDLDALSPPLDDGSRKIALHGPRYFTRGAIEDVASSGVSLEPHTSAPLSQPGKLLLFSQDGPVETDIPKGMQDSRRPLTRRDLLTEAFSYLGDPYGFGGQDGGRDCSRLQLDLFESFDLALPRHSGWQALAGTGSIEFAAGQSPADRMKLIDKAHERHIVLLHLPGHIMLYLGRNVSNEPMALHALGEFADPCAGGGETVRRVRKIVVSGLDLGQGSSRRSLIERLTKAVLFGNDPSLDPRSAPPADDCGDSAEHRIFISPAAPTTGQELRVIATNSSRLVAPELVVFGSEAEPLIPRGSQRFGGPPYTEVSRLAVDRPGRLTAALYDGPKLVACKRVAVRLPQATPRSSEAVGGPVWSPRWKWEQDTENLWSAFVEALFDDPATDETTWSDLHSLLRQPRRNLLYDHLGMDEDGRIELEPDCADLPYMLRAYFSWKLKLPFAFRRCSRGRPGQPPTCGPLVSNTSPRHYNDDAEAFFRFASRDLRSGVHSASGRTHPNDDNTDMYPVALSTRTLPPGTVYADPYGHVMMVSKWYAQGSLPNEPYGVLIAAEAQPDGTIGRRRFWEGSFLFDPDTTDVGAGFKHFRPLRFDRGSGEMTALGNDDLGPATGTVPFSAEQYGLTREGFYEKMDALINPMPLDPQKRQQSLIDALEEAVRRRLVSVDNAIQYAAQGGATIPMPDGYSVFETTGPWEDYSTPARDMRLLIAIDTVLTFADKVAARPERYQVGERKPDIKALRGARQKQLEQRSFSYVRSDGSTQTLTLADVVARRDAFEMAYNPNDCVELRWAAPPDSSEFSTCKRHAPAEQLARMKRYRSWFSQRKRPPRGG